MLPASARRGRCIQALLPAALALMIGVSSSASGWGNGLPVEPNTPQDRLPGRMFSSPDWTSNGRRVFLDAYVLQRPLGDAFRAGVGNAGTAIQVFAFLGVWKDCNGDSSMGQAAMGTLDYRSSWLDAAGQTRCPSNTGTQRPGDPPVINNGDWVRELRWLTPDPYLDPNGRPVLPAGSNEYPALANVWADWGDPDSDYDPHAATPVRLDEPVSPGPKRQPDFRLTYHRATVLSEVSQLPGAGTATSPTMFDPTRGLGALLCNEAGSCSGWWSDVAIVSNPGVRHDGDVLELGPAKAFHITTYAEFAPTAGTYWGLEAPSSPWGGFLYGAPQCTPEWYGVRHGWECYGPYWNGWEYVPYEERETRYMPQPGSYYQMSDTDPFNLVSHVGSGDPGAP